MPTDQQSLPSYTYVPGETPHPGETPSGHVPCGVESDSAGDRATERGFRLFDAGYYWEAHEVWEQVWLAEGRRGALADLVKGLIKLAAAGVKCLEGNRAGAVRHAARAAELLGDNGAAASSRESLSRLDVAGAVALAMNVRSNPPLADESRRAAAHSGGVPILGPLPRTPGRV